MPAAIPDRADVCIYAATPAGICAALAIAREGRSVVVVEPSRWVGGILGAGIKPAEDCPKRAAVGGLAGLCIDQGGRAPAQTRAWFQERLTEAGVGVLFEHRLSGVQLDRGRIAVARFEHAPPDAQGVPPERALPGAPRAIAAQVFIDASYEGDLLAQAGVGYAVGRESAERHGERFAGVQAPTNVTPIDPWRVPGDPTSGLIDQVEADHGLPVGAADSYTQAYNFRFYVTGDAAHRVPLDPGPGYDAARFELVGRFAEHLVRSGAPERAFLDMFPGWLNDGEYNYKRESLVSIAPLGLSRTYQDADYATRSRIWREHIAWLAGLHRFLSTDRRVPEPVRARVAALGLDRRHHEDTGGWPHQLYVRVARRMVGRYVLTEHDVLNRTMVHDAVGLALFGVDTYPVRRMALRRPDGGWAVATEGNMFIGSNAGTGIPFGVPYRALTPLPDECANLLVPVCLSATYIAYAAARMEPVFMLLGESCGVAACHAIAQRATVQGIDVPRLQARLREVGQVLEWVAPSGR